MTWLRALQPERRGHLPTVTIDTAATSVGTFEIASGTGIPGSDTPASTWSLNHVTGTQFAFCTACATATGAGSAATEFIIGGPNSATGIYSAADYSIKNHHDPYILGSGDTYITGALAGLVTAPTWTFIVPTMTPDVTI